MLCAVFLLMLYLSNAETQYDKIIKKIYIMISHTCAHEKKKKGYEAVLKAACKDTNMLCVQTGVFPPTQLCSSSISLLKARSCCLAASVCSLFPAPSHILLSYWMDGFEWMLIAGSSCVCECVCVCVRGVTMRGFQSRTVL